MNIFRSLVTAMHLYTKAGFREVSLYLFDTVLITSGSVFCLYGLTWPSSQRLEIQKHFFAFAHQQQYSPTKLGQVANVGVRSPTQFKMTYAPGTLGE